MMGVEGKGGRGEEGNEEGVWRRFRDLRVCCAGGSAEEGGTSLTSEEREC